MKTTEIRARDLWARDVWAGLLIMGIALLFGSSAIDYPTGDLRRLDSGAFPVMLSGLLFVLGLAITATGIWRRRDDGDAPWTRNWTWRGVILILLPPVLFGLFVREIGLVVSLFVVTLLCAFASQLARLHVALLLASVLTLFCVGVFVYGLGLPIPLLGRWLGGY